MHPSIDGLDLVDRTLELVRIPSVTGAEAQICDLLQRRLTELVAPPGRAGDRSHQVLRIGDNLVLWPAAHRAGGHRATVALVGHLDTVPPGGDNPPRREGDRIYGRGASDMKGGVALMWHLLAAPLSDPAYDLAFVFYSREEGPFEASGLAEVLQACTFLTEVGLAVCLEPSDNVLQLGCLGSLHAEVTFRGRAAHSARPWQGDNAIHGAADLLAALAALAPREVRFGDLIYREVLSATLARGGTARNVVPDTFQLNLNYRFAPGRSLVAARRRIEELVAGRAEVRLVDQAPAGPIPQGNAILADFRRRCALPEAPKQAWTDIARLAAAGIDAVNFGPGQSDQAHQPDEHASITHLLEGDRLLRRLLSTQRCAPG